MFWMKNIRSLTSWASLPREYSSVVEQVKIDRRTGSTLISMDQIKKGQGALPAAQEGIWLV